MFKDLFKGLQDRELIEPRRRVNSKRHGKQKLYESRDYKRFKVSPWMLSFDALALVMEFESCQLMPLNCVPNCSDSANSGDVKMEYYIVWAQA